jgi:hypothetical protein
LTATLSALLGVACSFQPVPLAARKGSTIVIPLAGGSNVRVGFSALGHVDRQYGTTHAFLVPYVEPGPDCGALDPEETDPADPAWPGIEAPVRWLTRAWPDPASPAAIENSLPSTLFGQIFGQVVALIDIPRDEALVPGAYAWCFFTRLPDGTVGPPYYEGELFGNFGTPPPMGPFEVLDGPPAPPTPPTGYAGLLGGSDVTRDLERLIPYHKAYLYFDAPSGAYPAAAAILVTYPDERIEIKSVFEENHSGRGSIVLWDADTPGELRIHFASPGRVTSFPQVVRGLAVAFDVRPESGAAAEPGDFVVVESETRLYDRDGFDLSSAVGVGVGNRIW